VNFNDRSGNERETIGSSTGATTEPVNLNASGGSATIDMVGSTTNATVNLTNSTGQKQELRLVEPS
jgi:hypothetical protein